MLATITIKDESAAGKILNKILLDIENEIMTVEELIKLRVTQEVEQFNTIGASANFNGLVQPTDTERMLNGTYKMKQKRQIDAEKQCYIALKAFQENAYFILVNNQQVDTLQHEIHLDKDSELSFVKLTPLVGG